VTSKDAAKVVWFNRWLMHCLFPELHAHVTFIMDNATFHHTAQTRTIFAKAWRWGSPRTDGGDLQLVRQRFRHRRPERSEAAP
jgi:hypothetical protein